MAISASQIVQINPSLLRPGGRDLELNGLILSTNESIPTDTVLPFGDPESVTEYFGSLSEESSLGQIYFNGFNNSHIKPRALFFYKMVKEAVAPWVRGSKNTATLAQIKALTDGTLNITIGTDNAALTAIDFSSITSFSDAASTIQTKLQAQTPAGEDSKEKTLKVDTNFTNATCTYSSQFNAFIITGGQTGSDITISGVSGTVATLLNLTEAAGAVVSSGSDVVSTPHTMELILQQTQNWATFTQAWMPTQEEVLASAQWANSKGVGYLYVYSDNNPSLLQSNSTNTIASAIKAQNLGAVAGEWSDERYSAFVLGTVASIDYNRLNGAITTAFKSQEGLPANVETTTDSLNLIAQGMNFYGDYASRNDNFIFHYPGQMFGKYNYIDTYVNAIWFYNALQVSLLNGLNTVKRVPYTESGYTLIRAWIQDPVIRAVRNGVIDPGVTLSESQKAAINREAGLDISLSIEKTGYYVQVLDPGPQTRLMRDSATINLWYTYGGSIQRLEVSATALI